MINRPEKDIWYCRIKNLWVWKCKRFLSIDITLTFIRKLFGLTFNPYVEMSFKPFAFSSNPYRHNLRYTAYYFQGIPCMRVSILLPIGSITFTCNKARKQKVWGYGDFQHYLEIGRTPLGRELWKEISF